ncbi:lysozyme inhibitor LprI family protein [Ramlibacter sp. WS9]|uniref:lysozyme inhibitor LprI family protein n=1 Tax=Ramlibacter sp. WS9 TaxID=1882741 RepID=UPI001E58CF68|nr:hypothetical protein [Ramlibacter sp. WS9]
MRINSREGIILASGVVLGAAVSAAIVLAPRWRSPAAGPTGTVTAQRVAMAPKPRVPCPLAPAAAPSGEADGRFQIPPGLSSDGPSDVGAFMAVGKEAAAAGRTHDAEVAFIMACRVADQFKGRESAESGRVRDRLVAHYDALLRDTGHDTAARRGELLRRVELLRPGHPAPAVEAAKTPAPPVLSKPQFVQTDPPKPQPRRPELAKAAPARVPQKAVAASSTHASFDCAKARSVSEKLICSDAQLARLDRELGQLHARAKISARNTWAFQQRSDEEWRRREATCRDRECLLRWYGQRRYQLMNEIESG